MTVLPLYASGSSGGLAQKQHTGPPDSVAWWVTENLHFQQIPKVC